MANVPENETLYILGDPNFDGLGTTPHESLTDQEVLDKATKKAIKAGWAPSEDVLSLVLSRKTFIIELAPVILFDKEFCIALWGDKAIEYEISPLPSIESKPIKLVQEKWAYHLQNMVISENPINYLERHM